jgi:DNA replication protein DnaC
MKDRQQRWYDKKRDKILRRYFTPRIQKELQGIEDDDRNVIDDNKYLQGAVNSGKTINICKMLLNTIYRDYLQGTPHTYYFIEVSRLLSEIKQSFDNPEISEYELIERFISYDVLVIDDFGTKKVTPWVYEVLYRIINGRYENLKPTGYTSNLSIEELIERLQDERLPRRMESKMNK